MNLSYLTNIIQVIFNVRSNQELALIIEQNSEILELKTINLVLSTIEKYKVLRRTDLSRKWEDAAFKIAGFMEMKAKELIISRHWNQSEIMFNKLLIMLKALLAQQPHQWQLDLANILSDFSTVQWQLQKFKDAEQSILEALAIYRRTERKIISQPDTSANLARVMNNLGTIQRDLRKLEDAEKSFGETIKLWNNLYLRSYPSAKENLASSLNGKGATEVDLKKFEQAKVTFERALKLVIELNETSAGEYDEIVSFTYNNLGTVHRDLKNYVVGKEMFEKALSIRHKLKEKDFYKYAGDFAWTLINLGDTHRDMRKFTDGAKFLLESVEIYQSLVAELPFYKKYLAHALNDLGNIQGDLKEYDKAIKNFDEALKIRYELALAEPQVFKKDLISTILSLSVLYGNTKHLEKSKNLLIEALKIYSELSESEQNSILDLKALILHNLGETTREIGDLHEAEKNFKNALSIRRKLSENHFYIFGQDLANTLNYLGNTQRQMRSFFASETNLRESVELFRTLFEYDPKTYIVDLASALTDIGALMVDINKNREAELYLKESLKLNRSLIEENATFFNFNISMTLHNLGGLMFKENRFEEAKLYLQESLDIRRNLGKTHSSIFKESIANTLITFGSVQKDLREFESAKSSFLEALKYLNELASEDSDSFKIQLGMNFNNLATVQFELGEIKECKESFNNALSVFQQVTRPAFDLTKQILSAEVLNGLGHFYLWRCELVEDKEKSKTARYCSEKAIKYFKEAQQLIDNLRNRAVTIDDRHQMMNQYHRIYSGLLACYIKLEDPKKVLETAESGKSRSVTDLLNLKSENLKPKTPTPETAAIVESLGRRYAESIKSLQHLESIERNLVEHLITLENKVIDYAEETDKNQPNLLEQTILSQKAAEQHSRSLQKDRLLKQAELHNVLEEIGKYDKDFPPKAEALSAESILEISKDFNRTIVIFRFLRTSVVVICVFPSGDIRIKEILDFSQHQMFNLFSNDWLIPYAKWRSGEAQFNEWSDAIESTLETIYQKLLRHVHQILKENSKCNDILLIPNQSLALLPLHAASWKDEDGVKHYLIEEYSISYASSLSVFKRCQENEKQRSDKTLLITNPTADLDSSEQEALFIENIHKLSKKLIKSEATKSAAIEALQKDYGFNHFACHGFYDYDNPFQSGLVMSDGTITLSEVINCDLQNNWLTTLSACETGIVDFASPTDEHFGLPLGFIFAGSPSVWASLWSVSDSATTELMKMSYENLSKQEYKNNKIEALRQAQLVMVKNNSHPFFWAGFQHFGV